MNQNRLGIKSLTKCLIVGIIVLTATQALAINPRSSLQVDPDVLYELSGTDRWVLRTPDVTTPLLHQYIGVAVVGRIVSTDGTYYLVQLVGPKGECAARFQVLWVNQHEVVVTDEFGTCSPYVHAFTKVGQHIVVSIEEGDSISDFTFSF